MTERIRFVRITHTAEDMYILVVCQRPVFAVTIWIVSQCLDRWFR